MAAWWTLRGGSVRILIADHHAASVADINGDGHLDVIVTAITNGVPTTSAGVFFLMGDGQGNRTRSESRVPSSIRFKTPWNFFNIRTRRA